MWEADHRLEVRQGGGEAGRLSDFDPLCVACHRGKTNRTAAQLRAARGVALTFDPNPNPNPNPDPNPNPIPNPNRNPTL